MRMPLSTVYRICGNIVYDNQFSKCQPSAHNEAAVSPWVYHFSLALFAWRVFHPCKDIKWKMKGEIITYDGTNTWWELHDSVL